jgi:hypothetical protein
MNNIENLVIDNYPTYKNNIISTEFEIDVTQEISISINNSTILENEDIIKISNNNIELNPKVIITNEDTVIVIYNKL